MELGVFTSRALTHPEVVPSQERSKDAALNARIAELEAELAAAMEVKVEDKPVATKAK